MLKITYTPDSTVRFYYFGMEEVGIDLAIEANKREGDYGTPEDNAEMDNRENYVVEELAHRDVLREIEDLVNDKNNIAQYDGAILTITSY